MNYGPCGKCIGPECICHEVSPEKLDGRTIQEWAYIARGFAETSDRAQDELEQAEVDKRVLTGYARALRHWVKTHDPFWDGGLEDLDRDVPPPDVFTGDNDMAVQLTFKDGTAVTLDDICGALPGSIAARQARQARHALLRAQEELRWFRAAHSEDETEGNRRLDDDISEALAGLPEPKGSL